MIMNREQLVVFEKWAARQMRIWDDACDYGVRIMPVKGLGVLGEVRTEARTELRRALKQSVVDGRVVRHVTWSTGQSWTLWFPVEHDEGTVVGTVIELSWNKCRGVEFLSIGVSRGREDQL